MEGSWWAVQVRLIPLSSVAGAALLLVAAAGAATATAPPAVAATAGDEELVIFVLFSTLTSESFIAIVLRFVSFLYFPRLSFPWFSVVREARRRRGGWEDGGALFSPF